MIMDWRSHARTTGTALKNWFIAQCQDSLAVALLIPFWWAILLAPPLLAVFYAFKRKAADERNQQLLNR